MSTDKINREEIQRNLETFVHGTRCPYSGTFMAPFFLRYSFCSRVRPFAP